MAALIFENLIENGVLKLYVCLKYVLLYQKALSEVLRSTCNNALIQTVTKLGRKMILKSKKGRVLRE